MGAIKLDERRARRSPRARKGASEPAQPSAEALAPAALPATFTARLIAVDDRGNGWIGWDDEVPAPAPSARSRPARSTVALAPQHVGREVLVSLAGRPARPIIVGVLVDAGDGDPLAEHGVDLVVERRRVVFAATTEVVLRCGQGSITLGADDKVTVRGLDIVSTAARTQRIRGGAVRIN